MQINMKDYNLDNFKQKDLYTFDEIISVIEDLEGKVKQLENEIEENKNNDRDDCYQEYDNDRATLAYNINLESRN